MQDRDMAFDPGQQDRELQELHREQAEMGVDPDYVQWLLEVERQLDQDLGEDNAY